MTVAPVDDPPQSVIGAESSHENTKYISRIQTRGSQNQKPAIVLPKVREGVGITTKATGPRPETREEGRVTHRISNYTHSYQNNQLHNN